MKKYPKPIAPRKRTSGKGTRWMARVQDMDNGVIKQKSVGTFKTKSEAIQQAYDYCDETQKFRENALDETLITVRTFVKEVWFEIRSKEVKSMSQMKAFLDALKRTKLDEVYVQNLNRASLIRFWQEMNEFVQSEGLSKSYWQKLRANMNSLMDCAVQNRLLSENPNFNLRIRTGRDQKLDRDQEREQIFNRSQKIWTFEKIEKYLPLFRTMGFLNKKNKSIDSVMWWAFLTIGIYTGLRKGEIAGLKFSDFDLEKKRLTVLRSVSVNDATQQVEVSSPKASSYGTLSITDEVVDAVETLLLYHQVAGSLKSEFLFQYKNGGLINPKYWSRYFKKIQIQAGIPEEDILPSSHYMRHTHLSLLAYKGYSMPEIQRRARHSDPRTTAKYYVHILDERESQMAEDFAQSLRSEENQD